MELRGILRELNNPNSVIHGVVSTAAVTGLALVEPRKLTTGRRLAYRSAIAGLTAWVMHASLRPVNEDDFDIVGPVGRAAITTGTAGAVFGIAEVGEKLDARLHDSIKRAGVRHPRLWMATGEGAVSAATWFLGRRFDNGGISFEDIFNEAFEEAMEEEERVAPNRTLHEVPENLRAIISAMLEATDEFGAPQLREQLAAASVYHWNGAEPDFNSAQFHVPNHIPRLVPGNYRFPVIGRFTALGDLTFTIQFFVDDGYLGSVHIEDSGDWTQEQLDRWEEICEDVPERDIIPSPDKVELLIETNSGYQPVER